MERFEDFGYKSAIPFVIEFTAQENISIIAIIIKSRTVFKSIV